MTIEKYIAINNPKAAAYVVESFGAPKVTGNMDLMRKIHYATDKFGMPVFEKLAQIDTPYRKLILSSLSEKKSNCGGCSMADGELENMEKVYIQTEKKTENPTTHSSMNNHLMVAGVVLLGILTIAVVVKK